MPKIIYKEIGEVIPYFNNPRNNEDAVEKVAESIKQFGFQNPIIVDNENVIIAGHTRLKAAELLGLDVVPVIVAESLTEEGAKAYRLADNKTGEFAEWDFEKLSEEIAELNDFDLSAFGFNLDELGFEKSAENDNFDVSEALEDIEEPTTKKGDLYRLGNHYLLCGDSTNESDVKRLMQGEKADLFLTDPPYNVNYEGTAGKIENDNMNDRDFKEFLHKAFLCADSVMKAGAAFYIWHADSEGYNFRGACFDIGWQVRQCLIWVKNSLVMGRQDYQWKHEPCLYGWKDGAAHYFIDSRIETTVIDDKPNINKMSKDELKEYIKELRQYNPASTIINEDKPTRSEEHPTMKPVKLFGYLIKNSTRKGETVLDLFGGSGTTLITCEQLNRRCFMAELDPKYCDVIIKRWETLTGRKAELVNG